MKNNRHFTDALFEEFDFFNEEVNDLLTEDLDTMLKYYNNLQNWDKQELLKFLTKDPTWNENKEQGQYSKWILDKLNRNLLNNSHLGHLRDVLKRFEDNKKYLKNKDINKFKSVQEIDTHLNDDNNYNKLSHSQIVRQHRKDKQNVDLDTEAKLIYEDSNWEIWIPKTYAASCKLGQGSSWCTASTETSEYFEEYSEEGPLYIILNKHNEKEKYQFHFESESYMDIDDNDIDLVSFIKEEKNKKLINVLRQYNKHFDERCEDILGKIEKAYKELNNLLQKTKSLEIIKYPTHKDIIEKFKKFTFVDEYDKYLTLEDFNKIQNIKLEVENSVIEIEDDAFKALHWIKQVIFEKNSKLKHIGNHAFASCTSLTNITIPEGVTSIGWGAFYDCTSLESIEIPNSVTDIDFEAFSYCTSLTSIIIPNSVTTSIGVNAFEGCTSLISVVIGNNVTYIEYGAFSGCTSLTTVEIPSSVIGIGDYAFSRCDSLTSVIIQEGVEIICERAFYRCGNSLKNIEIPNSVTSIESDAFEGCPNLMIKTSNLYVINYCEKTNMEYYLD